MHDLPNRPSAGSVRSVELVIVQPRNSFADALRRFRDFVNEARVFRSREAFDGMKTANRITELFVHGHS